VPFIASWPGKIPAGSVSGHVSGFNDFMVTACDIAGIGVAPAKTDGVSYLPTLLGQPEKQQSTYRYYKDTVRVGDWKLFKQKRGKKYSLYNLKEDIGEEHDVAKENPEVVERLKIYLEKAVQPL